MKRLVLLIGLFVVGQSFVSTAKGAGDITSMAEELSIAQTVNSGAEAATPNLGMVKEANVATPDEKAANLSTLPTNVVEANAGDVNTTGVDDVNATKEPNTEDLEARISEDLEKAFESVKQDGQKERGEWLRFEPRERIGLAKTVQNQTMDELKVLREIAAEEKADKTIKAIDMLIADRKERYEKVISRMELEEEKIRRREQLREERSRDRGEPRRNERLQRSREIPPKRETTGPNVGNY